MRFTVNFTADLFNRTPSEIQWLSNNATQASKPFFLSRESEALVRVEAEIIIIVGTLLPNGHSLLLVYIKVFIFVFVPR